MAFIDSRFLGRKEQRIAYWMHERYEKPELAGCTLWLVTSYKPPHSRYPVYSLVAKLVNCAVTMESFRPKWPLKLKGSAESRQYSSNFMNYVLMGLRFSSNKPINYFDGRIGKKGLRNVRELTPLDVELLEDYSSVVASRPAVFLSYSHKDERIREIEAALTLSGIGVFRDLNSISLGSDWRRSIEDAIRQAAVFVYLHSAAAAESREVRKEIRIALDCKAPGEGAIVALLKKGEVLPADDLFRQMARYQYFTLQKRIRKPDLRDLVMRIQKVVVAKAIG